MHIRLRLTIPIIVRWKPLFIAWFGPAIANLLSKTTTNIDYRSVARHSGLWRWSINSGLIQKYQMQDAQWSRWIFDWDCRFERCSTWRYPPAGHLANILDKFLLKLNGSLKPIPLREPKCVRAESSKPASNWKLVLVVNLHTSNAYRKVIVNEVPLACTYLIG